MHKDNCAYMYVHPAKCWGAVCAWDEERRGKDEMMGDNREKSYELNTDGGTTMEEKDDNWGVPDHHTLVTEEWKEDGH